MTRKIKPSDLKVGDWVATQKLFAEVEDKEVAFANCKIAKVISFNYSQLGVKCWNMSGEEVLGKAFINVEQEIFLLNQEEVIEIKKLLSLEE